MLPIMIHEQSVKSFYFYQEGSLYEGINHHNRLYKLARAFRAEESIQAQVMACNLIQLGGHVIITASYGWHKVWVELRADQDRALVDSPQETQEVEAQYA